MFGKGPQVNPLESRRRLLVAESEINRVELLMEWQTIAEGVHGLADRAKTMGAWASTATLLVAAVTALRRGAPAPAANSSWLQRLLNGMRVVATIWSAFLPRAEKEERT
jgi:hypothetical protein